jgi:hypothetical protein
VKNTTQANPGDIIRCFNGHELYRLLGSVAPGMVMASKMFDPIGNTPKPVPGKMLAPCHVCGMPWVTQGPGGGWVLCNVKLRFET